MFLFVKYLKRYDQIRCKNENYRKNAYGKNDRCIVQALGFGYNLGVIVEEKTALNSGIEGFMEMHI
jgi:hypothetical protein